MEGAGRRREQHKADERWRSMTMLALPPRRLRLHCCHDWRPGRLVVLLVRAHGSRFPPLLLLLHPTYPTCPPLGIESARAHFPTRTVGCCDCGGGSSRVLRWRACVQSRRCWELGVVDWASGNERMQLVPLRGEFWRGQWRRADYIILPSRAVGIVSRFKKKRRKEGGEKEMQLLNPGRISMSPCRPDILRNARHGLNVMQRTSS